jgi:hypothetical protein
MPNRSSKRGQGQEDINQIAFGVVQQVIGEAPKERRVNSAEEPAAVTLGRLGGLRGAKARAAKLDPIKRKEIAQKAARKRWRNR